MYSYIKDNNENNKTAKGIKNIVIKKDIQHKDYKHTLFNNKQMYHSMKTIRGDHRQLGSYSMSLIKCRCHALMIRDIY